MKRALSIARGAGRVRRRPDGAESRTSDVEQFPEMGGSFPHL
jgi:hypothetical protein